MPQVGIWWSPNCKNARKKMLGIQHNFPSAHLLAWHVQITWTMKLMPFSVSDTLWCCRCPSASKLGFNLKNQRVDGICVFFHVLWRLAGARTILPNEAYISETVKKWKQDFAVIYLTVIAYSFNPVTFSFQKNARLDCFRLSSSALAHFELWSNLRSFICASSPDKKEKHT